MQKISKTSKENEDSKKPFLDNKEITLFHSEHALWFYVYLRRVVELVLLIIIIKYIAPYAIKGIDYFDNLFPLITGSSINLLKIFIQIGVYYAGFNIVAGLIEFLQQQAVTHDLIEYNFIFSRPIKGHIIKLGLFSVKVKTLDDEYINIPNIKYIVATVKRFPRKNYSKSLSTEQ